MDYKTGTVGICYCFCNFSYLTFLAIILTIDIIKSAIYITLAIFVDLKMPMITIGIISRNSLAFFLSYLLLGRLIF